MTAGPFSLLLRPQFRFSWNITGGVMHGDMSTNESGWLGWGLSPTSFLTFHGMNHADIVVASWATTAGAGGAPCIVEDFFNDSDFEGAPKLDVELGGTDDVLSYSCSAE
jgi:hypothetical protein